MTEKEENDLDEARGNLYDAIAIDEDRFETKLTAISAGAIMLALTFVATLDGCMKMKLLLYLGLAITGFALGMNMVMYLVGKRRMRRLLEKFDQHKKTKVYPNPEPNSQIVELSCGIDKCNAWNLGIMISGISILIIFVCLNL